MSGRYRPPGGERLRSVHKEHETKEDVFSQQFGHRQEKTSKRFQRVTIGMGKHQNAVRLRSVTPNFFPGDKLFSSERPLDDSVGVDFEVNGNERPPYRKEKKSERRCPEKRTCSCPTKSKTNRNGDQKEKKRRSFPFEEHPRGIGKWTLFVVFPRSGCRACRGH